MKSPGVSAVFVTATDGISRERLAYSFAPLGNTVAYNHDYIPSETYRSDIYAFELEELMRPILANVTIISSPITVSADFIIKFESSISNPGHS